MRCCVPVSARGQKFPVIKTKDLQYCTILVLNAGLSMRYSAGFPYGSVLRRYRTSGWEAVRAISLLTWWSSAEAVEQSLVYT